MRLMSFEANGAASWGMVAGDEVVDFGSVTFLPPIPNPDKIICIGLNYLNTIVQEQA